MRLSHLVSTPRLHPPRGFSNPTSLVDCSHDAQARVRVAVFGSFLGGEGFVSRLEGSGKYIIQTRSLSGLASWINPRF